MRERRINRAVDLCAVRSRNTAHPRGQCSSRKSLAARRRGARTDARVADGRRVGARGRAQTLRRGRRVGGLEARLAGAVDVDVLAERSIVGPVAKRERAARARQDCEERTGKREQTKEWRFVSSGPDLNPCMPRPERGFEPFVRVQVPDGAEK